MTSGSNAGAVKVFILSRNRPIYLWACLDALYRLTRHPARFVLIESASSDPGIEPVIAGFERRGMFERVVRLDENTPAAAFAAIAALIEPASDEIVAFVESDVVVEEPRPVAAGDDAGREAAGACWLGRMLMRMREAPSLAMLGSRVDTVDFSPIADIERFTPLLSAEERRDLIAFPERELAEPGPDAAPVIDPHNPPGRLLLLRVAALGQTGVASDFDLYQGLRVAGFATGISTEVRHRHLSSLALYDYPQYDIRARNSYMRSLSYRGRVDALLDAAEDRDALLSPDADVHVIADGVRVDPEAEDDRLVFTLPEGAERLQLVTRTGFAFGWPDDRCLGVCAGAGPRRARPARRPRRHPRLVALGGRQALDGAFPVPAGRRLSLRATGAVAYLLVDLSALSGVELSSLSGVVPPAGHEVEAGDIGDIAPGDDSRGADRAEAM